MNAQPDHHGPSSANVSEPCPYCGGTGRAGDVKIPGVSIAPEFTEPILWHRERPEFPPPPGCRRIWVPFRGFVDVDDDIRRRVHRFFNVPMLVLAVLVLPVLMVDYYLCRVGRQHYLLSWTVLIAHVTISAAFMIEFAVKVRIAQSRLGYIVANWLDVVIIILPFLRPFRALRPARAAYAVRGVGVNAVRMCVPVVLGLRFVQRYQKPAATPARVDYAKWPRAALLTEVTRLAGRVHDLEARPADSQELGEDDTK